MAQARIGEANGKAFVAILRTCAKRKDLTRGRKLHDVILRRGLLDECLDALVTMYAKCGELAKAKELFDTFKSRDVLTWTAVMASYVQKHHGHDALNLFWSMQHEGLSPDAVTYTCVLKACGIVRAADRGKEIHEEIAKQGLFKSDITIGNALVDMYVKCGALEKASHALKELPKRDVISWTTLIAGYADHGEGEQALNCLEWMQREGISPNAATFVCILKACGSIGAAHKGEKIHEEIAKQDLMGDDTMVGNALIDMYAKCGDFVKAARLLEELPERDVIPYNALITQLAEHGEGEQALGFYERMQQDGLSPNAVTFIAVLKAYSLAGAADKGEKMHVEIAKQRLLDNHVMLGTAVVDMYAKCGALTKARQMLEGLNARDVVSWNALLIGYAEHGEGAQALECYEQMQSKGFEPNAVTFMGILKACSSIGAADQGQAIHYVVAKQGLLRRDIMLGTCVVDMYAKCGALTKARQVLEQLPVRNVVSWNALIAGYAEDGQVAEAMDCLQAMQGEGLAPNEATLSSVLSACNRLGLVEDAMAYFVEISNKYGICPDLEHYTCLIDLLGRTGHLDRAIRIINHMPSSTTVVWSALLAAYWKWGDVETAKWVFEQALVVDESDSAVYDPMTYVSAAAGLQKDGQNSKAMRIPNKAWKKQQLEQLWIDSDDDSSVAQDIQQLLSIRYFDKLHEYILKVSFQGISPTLNKVELINFVFMTSEYGFSENLSHLFHVRGTANCIYYI